MRVGQCTVAFNTQKRNIIFVHVSKYIVCVSIRYFNSTEQFLNAMYRIQYFGQRINNLSRKRIVNMDAIHY